MNTKFRKNIIICLFLFVSPMTFAQTHVDKVDVINYNSYGAIAADSMLKKRCTEKVSQMCDYIKYMVNPQNSENNRSYYRRAALNLFIGQGNAYEEDGIEKKGVFMEVTSINYGSKNRLFMRNYFSNLIKRLNYSKVVMQTTNAIDMKVSDLKPLDENTYVCTVYFEQKFLGLRDGRVVYGDKTKKRFVCYVKVEQTPDGKEFLVLLGDVTATDTEKIS